MIDILGRKIKPGDICVYPVRQGSAMWLSIARIDEFVDVYLTPSCESPHSEVALATKLDTGRKVELLHGSRLAIIIRGTDLAALEELNRG